MRCTDCSQENPPSAKFCQECGAALGRICPQCSAVSPPGAKFCPECGRRWSDPDPCTVTATARAAELPETGDALAGERRQATILFADMAGYTAICAQSDAEQIQAMLNVFYECVDAIVSGYGGHVVDHAGDGVLAVFGAPIAHGNDAEHAVRAAFDMHRQCTLVQDPQGEPVGLHIGIATGEVVAANIVGGSHRRYGVTGDTVNLASRLSSVATCGQSVLSDGAYRTVEPLVECTSLGERRLKGLNRPVMVWLAERVREAAFGAFPFAGRRLELGQLTSLLENIAELGSGRPVLIRGDPGIGKSRLVEELRARAQARGFECHLGQTMDFGVGKGQGALAMILRGILGISSQDDTARAVLAVDTALAQDLVTHDELPLLLDILNLPLAAAQRSVLHAIDLEDRKQRTARLPAFMAQRRARSHPLLLVVEDIHWAPDDLLGALALLAGATREGPILLVMTSRIQGDPIGAPWKAATAGAPLMILELGPLRDEEALAIASELVDRSESFARECVDRSEGNPLYLVQLLLNARGSDALRLPGTIQSLVLARLDQLARRDKLVVQAAAVIGFRFSLDTVRELCGDPDYRCDAPIAAGLIRPQEGVLCFSHALIQEGIYASLLHPRRRELHRMAAQHFRTVDLALSAAHLDRAGDSTAPVAYLAAARHQRESYRADHALVLLGRGLELSVTPADEFELRRERGNLLTELGRADASLQDFDAALALAGNDAERARAWIGMSASMGMSDRFEEALHLLDQAQLFAQAAANPLDLVRIHHLRGNLFFPLGRIEECLQEQEKALQFADEVGSVEWQVRALSGLADAYYGACRMQSAYQTYTRCVTRSREHGLGRAEVANLAMAVMCAFLFMEPIADVIRRSQEAVTLSRKLGQKRAEVLAHHVSAMVLLSMEDGDGARPHAHAAVDIAREIGAHRFVPEGMLFVAKCLQLEGKDAQSAALLREALDLCRPAMDYFGPYVLGELAAASDDPQERERCLAEGERLLEKSSLPHNAAFFYRAAIDLWVQQGDWDRVEHYARKLLAAFEAEPVPLLSFTARAALAVANVGRGERGQALDDELGELLDAARRSGLAGYERRLAQTIRQLESVGPGFGAKAG